MEKVIADMKTTFQQTLKKVEGGLGLETVRWKRGITTGPLRKNVI